MAGATPRNKRTTFPYKLLTLLNSCHSGAISWSHDGKSVVVRETEFTEQFLNKPGGLFKASNFSSFVRQMNLYGFSGQAFRGYDSRDSSISTVQLFRHENFQRGAVNALPLIGRRIGTKKMKENQQRDTLTRVISEVFSENDLDSNPVEVSRPSVPSSSDRALMEIPLVIEIPKSLVQYHPDSHVADDQIWALTADFKQRAEFVA